MLMTCRVLFCGVGGQGTILAAHVAADVALASGLDVKVSEIHGMAQRGGSVTTVVTFGREVKSMVSGAGESDLLVSFDKLEALRNLDQLKSEGHLVVNDEVVKPASVLTGRASLPGDSDAILQDAGALMVPADAIAREAGNAKCANVVMLGALSALLDFDEALWVDSVSASVPPKTVDVNVAAFRAGRSFAEEHMAS